MKLCVSRLEATDSADQILEKIKNLHTLHDTLLAIPYGNDTLIPPSLMATNEKKTASALFYGNDTLLSIPDGNDTLIPLSLMATN